MTLHCYFEPFGPENDPLFQSQYFKQYNPGNHPSLNDSCVRKVPLSQIPQELVDDALNGGSKLVERFCAGVWGGYGKCSQRLGKPTQDIVTEFQFTVYRIRHSAEHIGWAREEWL